MALLWQQAGEEKLEPSGEAELELNGDATCQRQP